jgi:hypothetical protein
MIRAFKLIILLSIVLFSSKSYGNVCLWDIEYDYYAVPCVIPNEIITRVVVDVNFYCHGDTFSYTSIGDSVAYMGSINDTLKEFYVFGNSQNTVITLTNNIGEEKDVNISPFNFDSFFNINISEPNPCPTPNARIDISFDSTDLNDNFFYPEYNWSTGSTDSFISNIGPGIYSVTMSIRTPPGSCIDYVETIEIECEECEYCITSFAPHRGKEYVLSAWVSEDLPLPMPNFTGPEIKIHFPGASPAVIGPFKTGEYPIIDNWQQITEVFTVPQTATLIEIELINAGNNNVYYDDIRIHPVNSNFKSYVYDPVTLKLVAELDDNNFATYYEYNNEGQLLRTKKETSRGIQTIQEARQNTSKISSNP